jgi:hypothetical protein
MPIAADYPFTGILWSTLIFMAFLLWIWIAIMIFSDIFRRHDVGGFAKAMWIVLIIFVPLISAVVYVIAYHEGIADRRGRGASQDQYLLDQRVDGTVASSGPAGDIKAAQELLDTGTISQYEFEILKAKALDG